MSVPTSTTSFHLDPNEGTPRPCSKPLDCRWGSPEEHYPSAASAREAYEEIMRDFLCARFKANKTGRPTRELVTPRR